MPGKRDEIVLGSLLGACQRRRNADVGERRLTMHWEGLYLLVDDYSQNFECWKYDKAKGHASGSVREEMHFDFIAAYAGRLRLEYSEVEMNCYVESRDCFDSLICSVPVAIHFKWPGSAIWARVGPEGICSRHYPLILAGKLDLRQLNTLSY
uniref:Uncharacterized protein n=1 Tax=Populus alba TaxID=43335 RepID=A0A4V6A2A4_POPAL|nr:hypothetical protein D5086_0000281870 [Populus alba]